MELSNQLPGSHPLTAPVHPPERVTGPPELHHSEGRYLNRCSATRQQEACLEANTTLQALINQEEGAQQRLSHPRCLGALTQAETVLAAFRWRFENSGNLQQMIDAAAVQCPPNSATVSQ